MVLNKRYQFLINGPLSFSNKLATNSVKVKYKKRLLQKRIKPDYNIKCFRFVSSQ